MAERSKADDSEGLEKQLESLLSSYTGDELGLDSETFCADFCKLVEQSASRWRVPLPQLRILEIALRCFSQASSFLPTNCDHVQHTISSLALSVFELLLYFTQKDFSEEPLQNVAATFQECHSALAKYQNVYLLQVECMVQAGGPWASPSLQAILSEPSLPQNEVDGYIGSEMPVFFELRVRYLSFCGRVSEAVALAKFCVKHPAARQHLFFHQVYLSWLYKTLQHELLQKEVADVNGKDAVLIICNLECEETDKLLLALSTVFLRQQLQRGDMYCLCDLVRVWTNLHSRLKTSKHVLLEECRQLMFSATNVKSIFPFIRAILQEVGDDGIHFCVELCANALQSCLSCDVLTKTLIYKTIAGLLPDDLEVCRACALLVFFSERTVESYKMVYLLYMLPDQEYHVDDSPIGNNVRFETLQILKKDLYFDPEFWNLVALRTNCLKLLSEKVVSAALEEIMEDKWISKYSTKEFALRSCATVCHRGARNKLDDATKKRHHQDKVYQKESDTASKRLRIGTKKTRLNDHSLRRKSNQALKESSGYLRRSFWQLDRIHNLTLRYDDHRRTTRLSETNLPKRKIKKPRWLLEDSGALEENVPLKMKRNGLRQEKHLRSCVVKRSQTGPIKNTKHKPSVKTLLKARENDYQNGFSLDCSKPTPPPQVVLELSLPDNELMDTFIDDACSKPRTVPQVLLYRSTVKFPDTSPPGKTIHGKEVILRARDANMLVHQLHCYARRQRGKGNGASVHGSVSVITRSSAQGSPSKDSPGELCEKPVSELGVGTVETGKQTESQAPDEVLKDQSTKPELQQTSAVDLFENPPIPDAENITTSPDVLRSTRQPTESVLESSTCTRDLPENCPTVEGIVASLTLAEEIIEEPLLHNASQAQTVTAAGEPFEEPAVEMKVTIASQSPVLDRVPKSPTGEDVPTAQVSQTTKLAKNKKVAADEIQSVSISPNVSNTGASDPLNGQDVALESRDESKNVTADGSSVSMMDVADDSQKDSQVNVPCKSDTSPVKTVVQPCEPSETNTSANKSKISGKTAPTVTDLEELDDHFKDERQTPGSRVSKDSRGGSKPKAGQKTPTTSTCSVSEQEVSVVDRQEICVEATQDALLEMPENSELMETLPEPEESKLEHYCTFCSKDFKGPRVVEHAMFHYRKDECTFCRLIFKDDLLAMVHLSDHIEKLKRCKDQENEVSVAKDTSTPKTTAKAKTTNLPSGCQGKGKGRKFSVCSESIVNITTSESRTLRSNLKQTSGTSLHELQKHGDAGAAAHRVNGHIGQKTEITRLTKDLDKNKEFAQQKSSQRKRDEEASSRSHRKPLEMDSSVQVDQDLKSRENGKDLKMGSKQNVDEKKNAKPQEKLCCPADGCSWFADISKNRVTLLYHALEKHYGEIKPLELAFRVADNKCSICMRVLFSFEHFQHHVKRHRLVPRHPCLHLGCTERFKTGMEMRRHARKHSPLQATCCLPGCSKLFICLWALNLHEKEHYASKPVKHEKSTDVHTGDKLCETPSKKPVSEGNTESTSGYETTTKDEREETKISVVKNEENALTEKHPSENKTPTLKTISKSKCDPKQQDKAKGAAMILQGLQRLIKSTLDEKEKRKEASAPSIPTDTVNKARLSSATEENKPKLNGRDHAQKPSVEKNESGADKVGKKRKNVGNDDAKTVAKKKGKRSAKKGGKPSAEAQSAAGESSECEDKNPSETPFTSKMSVCSHTLSSAVLTDDATFKPCKATLAEYSKKPYMRVPPSVYLDERFITMPKRRRDLLLHRSQGMVSPEPVCVKPAQQRHRCANCFTTFISAEELRSHVERQKCSNLFGFDSDDEGSG
ncbi:uncharacterized protein LOC119429091 [Nematolebias whitei]|uniref:uncharacterized protein LOC119429091 n=1 Tax=Nematolebias whitei TaxID=451745 RepID=UPI00189A3057|nr:uncharacterized protein LOC119429091 [Nematolebias whitei]